LGQAAAAYDRKHLIIKYLCEVGLGNNSNMGLSGDALRCYTVCLF
jgi:hypothetical protein